MNRAQALSTLVKVAKLQQKLLTKLASKVDGAEINLEFGDSNFDEMGMGNYYVYLKTTYSGKCNGNEFKVEINRKLFIKSNRRYDDYIMLEEPNEYKLFINTREVGDGTELSENYKDIYDSMDTKTFEDLFSDAWDSDDFQKALKIEEQECERSITELEDKRREYEQHNRRHQPGWV